MTDITQQVTQQIKGTDLLHLAERRMSWLQRRESLLAGNVANANTPDYRPKDISPFHGVLDAQNAVSLMKTNPRHIEKNVEETTSSPETGTLSTLTGNKVSLEDELVKIADTNDQHRFATTVYGRYMSMYSMALGNSGS